MFEYRVQDRGRERTTRLGGTDLVFSLTADQAAALGEDVFRLAEGFDAALVTIAAKRSGADPVIPADVLAARPAGARRYWGDRPVSLGAKWAETAVREVSGLMACLAGVQEAALRDLVADRRSHSEVAGVLGIARATGRYRRSALTETSPAELWATGGYGAPDHPGQPVPEDVRDWALAWPGYMPVDITPPALRAEALAAGAPEWACDTVADPAEISTEEWRQRIGAALVPFDLDPAGRPRNPTGRTGRTGRNLPNWGETEMVDTVVVTKDGMVLLIQRGDTYEWAVAGGKVEPGEDFVTAGKRELREEAGLDLAEHRGRVVFSGYVPDPRATDRSWACTTVVMYEVDRKLPVTPGSDAVAATWWPMPDLDGLLAALGAVGASLYPAHRPILAAANAAA
jgi:ADP-ribose pyrophosphatase YjhB (NUDIX family)